MKIRLLCTILYSLYWKSFSIFRLAYLDMLAFDQFQIETFNDFLLIHFFILKLVKTCRVVVVGTSKLVKDEYDILKTNKLHCYSDNG